MTCSLCQREVQAEGLCQRCHRWIHRMLDDLYDLWKASHGELLPGNGGAGSSSGERTIGVNVAALSFIAGDDILKILHSWESEVRQERGLTPPAFLKKLSLEDEIKTAIRFAQAHLDWMGQQPWIGDFAGEVKDLVAIGNAAARRTADKVKRIACPADTAEGLPCGQILKLSDEGLLDVVECRLCGTQWTAIRLMAVALADNRKEIWLDADAIASYLNVDPSAVHKYCKRNKISKRGYLYNLKEILTKRKESA